MKLRDPFMDSRPGGLCAIALIDGGPDNTNRESQLEMLTKLRAKRAGGPLSFSWIDATCHTGFLSSLGLNEMDLPTMIALSPSKKRWARSIGGFNADTIGAFGTGVATGRIRTDEIESLPMPDEVERLPRLQSLDCHLAQVVVSRLSSPTGCGLRMAVASFHLQTVPSL